MPSSPSVLATDTMTVPSGTASSPPMLPGPDELAVLDFLNENFNDGHELWRQMSINHMGLSGSAALELFRRGSSDQHSDIDFYIAPNGNCIEGAIKALQVAGVNFASPFDHIATLYDKSGEYHCTIGQANRLLESFDQYWGSRTPSPQIRTFVEELRRQTGRATFTYGRSGFQVDERLRVVVKGPLAQEYDYLPNLFVLRGFTTKSKKAVQLMFAPGKSMLDQICRFHSTAVQVLITPYGAIQMYAEMTAANQAYSWSGNTTSSTGLIHPRVQRYQDVRDKWTQRGFTFTECQTSGHEVRRIVDSGALYRPYQSMAIGSKLALQRQNNLRAFAWHQSHDKTSAIPHMAAHEPGPAATSLHGSRHAAKELFLQYAIDRESLRWCTPDAETAI